MAIQNEPTRIQIPFADSGTKNVIPDTNSTPSASQAASWSDGFPAQCSLPLSAGGIPPARADFNGILNAMTQSERFTQEGGVWAWDATVDYGTNRLVLGSDSKLYWSIAQSGPNVGGAQNPTADNGTYWQKMPMDDADVVHIAGTQTITGDKNFEKRVVLVGTNIPANVAPASSVQRGLHITDQDVNDIADLFAYHNTNGDTGAVMRTYSLDGLNLGSLTVHHDATNDVFCAMAPSTSPLRTNGVDIVTRDWIPQDSRIVHTTGNETISGTKTIEGLIISGGASIRKPDDTSNIFLAGGSGLSGGSHLSLAGKSNTGGAGEFLLRAYISSAKDLHGYPNGTLTWNGQAVQTSSDERLKTPLASVPDAVLDAWEAVDWGQFQFLEAVEEKGEKARLHLGLIAQRVKAAFEERGLDACAYGILCHDEHPAVDRDETIVEQNAWIDEDGIEHPAVTHVEHIHEDAIDLWMVRYTEALAMEACCQRRRADRAEARLAALEERLAAIEAKLNAQP